VVRVNSNRRAIPRPLSVRRSVWFITGAPDNAQAISPVGPTVTITAGTPALALAITPTGPTVTVTAGTATVALEQAITPTGPTVTITAGTPALALAVALTGPTVTVTAGTPALAQAITPSGPTVTITAGTPALALAIALTGPTVTVTAGTATVALASGDQTIADVVGPTVTVTPGTATVAFASDTVAAPTGSTSRFRQRQKPKQVVYRIKTRLVLVVRVEVQNIRVILPKKDLTVHTRVTRPGRFCVRHATRPIRVRPFVSCNQFRRVNTEQTRQWRHERVLVARAAALSHIVSEAKQHAGT
jgi:hypothetical protein